MLIDNYDIIYRDVIGMNVIQYFRTSFFRIFIFHLIWQKIGAQGLPGQNGKESGQDQ